MLCDGALFHLAKEERDKEVLLQHCSELVIRDCPVDLEFKGCAWQLKLKRNMTNEQFPLLSFWSCKTQAKQTQIIERRFDALLREYTRFGSIAEYALEFDDRMSNPKNWQLENIGSWATWIDPMLLYAVSLGHVYRIKGQYKNAWRMYSSVVLHSGDANAKIAFIGNMGEFVPCRRGLGVNADAMVSIALLMANENIPGEIGALLDLCNTALAIDGRVLGDVLFVRAAMYANGTQDMSLQMVGKVLLPYMTRKMLSSGESLGVLSTMIETELFIWPEHIRFALLCNLKELITKYPRETACFQIEFNRKVMEKVVDGVMSMEKFNQLRHMMEASGMDVADLEKRMASYKPAKALSQDQAKLATELFKLSVPRDFNCDPSTAAETFEALLLTDTKICAFCSEKSPNARKCALCKEMRTYYCCKEHQAQHWKQHRVECSGYLAKQAAKK